MLVLVLIACLDDSSCRVVQLSEPQPIYSCMVGAQPLAAQWVGSHPGYKVRKVRCVRPAELIKLLDAHRA